MNNKKGIFIVGIYFQANSINNRVSTIYYEMGMCYLELGNIYQVKICFEKVILLRIVLFIDSFLQTIEIGNEHMNWKCLEQIIYFYFILGNFSSKIIVQAMRN